MKFVGIVKEYEDTSPVKIGRSITELIPSNDAPESIDKILLYLKGGVIILPFSRYVSDEEGGPKVPLIYYTDGEWIWVSYLVFFLERGFYSLLPDNFIQAIKANEFIVPIVSEDKKKEAIRYYFSVYDPEFLKRNG